MREVLRAVARIAAAATVAHADVQEPVRAERDHAAVVVLERLGDPHQTASACGVGDVTIARDAELRDHRGAGAVGVVDEEPPVRRIPRVEREAEESLLSAIRHQGRDVEERPDVDRAVGTHDPDLAALFDHEQPIVSGGRGDQQGMVEPGCDLRQAGTHAATADAMGNTAAIASWRRTDACPFIA